MKILLLLTACVTCVLSQSTPLAPLTMEDSPSRVPGEYVIVLKENIGEDATVHSLFARQNANNVLLHEYNIGSFRGYGARMDDTLRDQVRSLSEVKFVEASQVYETNHFDRTGHCCNRQCGAPWGLVRTTHVDRPSDEAYIYEEDGGQGVDVYVIDTGIDTTHPLFGGRAVWGTDCIDNPSPETDPHGHGTHVAGTVIANAYGIARGATAIAVRVLDQNGFGTTNTVICGINYVSSQHCPGKRSIINMSLGGRKSSALNAAVNSATEESITSVVAAGNYNSDACSFSPASASSAFTVAASDENDRFASFSNYGCCVSIIAPGVGITSLWADGGTNTLSGTSMAAPHVAGVMAEYLSEMSHATTPETLKNHVKKTASINKISGNLNGTPNKLVFKCC